MLVLRFERHDKNKDGILDATEFRDPFGEVKNRGAAPAVAVEETVDQGGFWDRGLG